MCVVISTPNSRLAQGDGLVETTDCAVMNKYFVECTETKDTVEQSNKQSIDLNIIQFFFACSRIPALA